MIGFSDGVETGFYLVNQYPGMIKKFIAIPGDWGSEDFTGKDKKFIKNLSGKYLATDFSRFVKERKKLIPEPDRSMNLLINYQ